MDGALTGPRRYPELLASAVDDELVKTREDAFVVTPQKGYFEVSVFILDIGHDRRHTSQYDYLAECPGFNRNWRRPALEIQMSVEMDGTSWLDRINLVDVILTGTYDKKPEPGERLPSPLFQLGRLTSTLTGRPVQDAAYMPKYGISQLMTVTNALLAEQLRKAGRNLLYQNFTEGEGHVHPFISPHPFGHARLGLAQYARFTSPCLRYDDRVNFMALKAALENRPDPFTKAELQQLARRENGFKASNDFKKQLLGKMRPVNSDKQQQKTQVSAERIPVP